MTIDEYLGGGDLSKGVDNKSLVKSRRELKSTVCQWEIQGPGLEIRDVHFQCIAATVCLKVKTGENREEKEPLPFLSAAIWITSVLERKPC